MKLKNYLILLVVILLQTNTVYSAPRDASSSGSDAATKMKLMLRQVMSEKEALMSKTIKLEAELTKLKSDVKAKENKIKSTNNKLKKSGTHSKKLSAKLKESYQIVTNLREEKNEIQSALRKMSIVKNQTESSLKICMKMNVDLFDTGTKVLNRYEKEVTDLAEPFFKLGFVELENVIQDYRFKLEDKSIPEDKINDALKIIENSQSPVEAGHSRSENRDNQIENNNTSTDTTAFNIENNDNN